VHIDVGLAVLALRHMSLHLAHFLCGDVFKADFKDIRVYFLLVVVSLSSVGLGPILFSLFTIFGSVFLVTVSKSSVKVVRIAGLHRSIATIVTVIFCDLFHVVNLDGHFLNTSHQRKIF
jgi:hypothetical protein